VGKNAYRPYEFKVRTEKSKAPEFASSAKLGVKRATACARGKEPKGSERIEKDCFVLTIPQALTVKGFRPVEYEIEVEHEGKLAHSKVVLDRGFSHSPDEAAFQHQLLVCPVEVEKLPQKGVFRFVVTPVGNFGKRGRPLKSPKLSV
jgi:hypothetical protein